jgi:phosphoserine phosphatase
MNILLIRHAESSGNIKDIIQGSKERLTEKGKQQTQELGEKLKKEKIEFVFSSDMQRAVETTQIAFPDTPITYTSLIEEKRNGDFEGKKRSEVDWTEINKQPFETRKAPNGESLEDVKKRAQQFLELLKKQTYNKIAVMSHGTFLRVLLSIITNKSMKEIILRMQLKNTQIIRVKLEQGKFMLQ